MGPSEKLIGQGFIRSATLAAVLLILLGTLAGAGSRPQAPKSEIRNALTVEGPFVHENLAVYVVRGRTSDPRDFITLGEALAAKTVTIREKGAGAGRDESRVNELEVENRSDQWLFLQAGDVIAGGKQDRTIAIDITLAPHSPPQAIDAFCVEHGRWAPKAAGLGFSANTGIVSGNELKLSIQKEKNQSRVWEEVARQERAAAVTIQAASPGEPVASLSESGTYNAIVDHKRMRSGREEYGKALLPHLQKRTDALGIVVAINGNIVAADIYASKSLFRKLSGKLLDSYALEAVLNGPAEGRSAVASPAPPKKAVLAFLSEPTATSARDEQVGPTMHRRTREAERVIVYEYRDVPSKAPQGAEPVHQNYLKKPGAE